MERSLHAAPTIASERLQLRSWRDYDFAPFFEMLSDANTEASIGIPGMPINRNSAWRSFATIVGHWQIRGIGEWAISHSSGAFVGYAGIWHPNISEDAELSWCIHPSYRMNGYATEATTLLLHSEYIHIYQGSHELVSVISDANRQSQKVAVKLGMVPSEKAQNPYRPHHIWRFKESHGIKD